jgi:hypothetical protein
MILRTYHYTNQLQIAAERFSDSLIVKRQGISFELSDISVLFLRKIFSLHSRNGEELNTKDLERIFYPCPDGIPKEDIEKFVRPLEGDEYVITKTEWYIFWKHMTHKHYKKSYKLLTYIGLQVPLDGVFNITK